jgi:DNA-binding protein H-NS
MRKTREPTDVACLESPSDTSPKRTVSKAGADLTSFQALVDGWNNLHGPSAQGKGNDGIVDPYVEPVDPLSEGAAADSVDMQLLQLITVDSRRLTEQIAATRLRLIALEAELGLAHAKERECALAVLRNLCRRYDLRVQDITVANDAPSAALAQSSVESHGRSVGNAAVQAGHIRGPDGEVWCGRGRRPNWLKPLLAEFAHA